MPEIGVSSPRSHVRFTLSASESRHSVLRPPSGKASLPPKIRVASKTVRYEAKCRRRTIDAA